MQPTETNRNEPADAVLPDLSLSLDQVQAPAFLVDADLHIRWMAPDGTDSLSRALAEQWKTPGGGDVFTVMVSPAVRGAIGDWKSFFTFLYTVLRRSTPRATFDAKADALPADAIVDDDDEGAVSKESAPFIMDSCPIGSQDTEHPLPLRMFSLGFGQGTLFTLRTDGWPSRAGASAANATEGSAIDAGDTKKSICALSARLHHSRRIAETMLPRIFMQLVQRIWTETDHLALSLGGRRIASDGAQALYLFKESVGRNPVFSAICCATRILAAIPAMEERFRDQYGWKETIGIDMGISHGGDDAAEADAVGSGNFIIPGGAFDQASRLSTAAAKGEIWITKDAAGQLPGKLLDRVVLGIDRQGHFRRNFFVRIGDLDGSQPAAAPIAEAGGFPVARIVSIEQNKPDPPVSNKG